MAPSAAKRGRDTWLPFGYLARRSNPTEGMAVDPSNRTCISGDSWGDDGLVMTKPSAYSVLASIVTPVQSLNSASPAPISSLVHMRLSAALPPSRATLPTSEEPTKPSRPDSTSEAIAFEEVCTVALSCSVTIKMFVADVTILVCFIDATVKTGTASTTYSARAPPMTPPRSSRLVLRGSATIASEPETEIATVGASWVWLLSVAIETSTVSYAGITSPAHSDSDSVVLAASQDPKPRWVPTQKRSAGTLRREEEEEEEEE